MKSPQSTKVTHLEQALQMWEEQMWCRNRMRQAAEKCGQTAALIRCPPVMGPMEHYQKLRRHLLSIRSYDEFETERFEVLLPPTEDGSIHSYSDWSYTPTDCLAGRLAAWTTSSRRVYRIDPDLQALLGATSLKSLTFDDVKVPFESFAIELAEPIYCPFTNRHFDFVLFSSCQGRIGEDIRSRRTITLFNQDIRAWRPLSSRAAIEKKFLRGQFEEVGKMLDAKQVLSNDADMLMASMVKVEPGVLITELLGKIAEMPGKEGVASRQAWQIVIGLAMYLKMLPPTSPHHGMWISADPQQRLLGSLDHRAITDESEICSVSSMRRLSAGERQLFFDYANGRSGFEMPVHFRIGYWHRPKGRGQDPEYPKTEWTHPTLVRADRLPQGAVPGGSQVDV